MWRLLEKFGPSLSGDSYDGIITGLAGDLVAMDADIISGYGFVEHTFTVHMEVVTG